MIFVDPFCLVRDSGLKFLQELRIIINVASCYMWKSHFFVILFSDKIPMRKTL